MDETAFRAQVGIEEPSGIWEDATLWSAIAFLAMLQITAVFFNLLPVPPLDGFGIIEPFLDERTRFQLRQFGMYGIFLIFLVLWFVEPVAREFWDMVFSATEALDISGDLVSEGFDNFMFWRNPPQ
jgi:Zn-dependent protease